MLRKDTRGHKKDRNARCIEEPREEWGRLSGERVEIGGESPGGIKRLL